MAFPEAGPSAAAAAAAIVVVVPPFALVGKHGQVVAEGGLLELRILVGLHRLRKVVEEVVHRSVEEVLGGHLRTLCGACFFACLGYCLQGSSLHKTTVQGK